MKKLKEMQTKFGTMEKSKCVDCAFCKPIDGNNRCAIFFGRPFRKQDIDIPDIACKKFQAKGD